MILKFEIGLKCVIRLTELQIMHLKERLERNTGIWRTQRWRKKMGKQVEKLRACEAVVKVRMT